MLPIAQVAHRKLGINLSDLLLYGHYKAKISLDYLRTLERRPNAKLILVTAITPDGRWRGKTTTTVGLGDALNHIGKQAIICLREPSLGPCFGSQRRRCGRRLCPGGADGRYQSPFHRRLPCHRCGQ